MVGITDYLNSSQFINLDKKNIIIFWCNVWPAISRSFDQSGHHINKFIMYLIQNVFPLGKACRDIALNTQHLVLYNNPSDRQQVANMTRIIYPSTSASFMKPFEDATSWSYSYLILDFKSSTSEQDRLKADIFATHEKNDCVWWWWWWWWWWC